MMASCNDETEEFYQRVFEDFPALIWRSGLDMKCDYFNRTWLAFTGRTLEQERGDGWVEGVHPDDVDGCVNTYTESFTVRKPFAMFYRLRNRFGEYRWIKDIGRPFYNPQNEFIGYIGSCYDVTEDRENARKLEELNRSKDKFFSIVAHDLTGPMAAIESLTGMLARDYRSFDSADLDEIMQELHRAAERAGQFLHDILSWSRSQLQGINCVPQSGSAFTLVEEAVEPLRESMRIKSISFSDSIDPALSVYADPNMVKTIIRNLVSNALKFSAANGWIRISGTTRDDYVLLCVSDEGLGIPARTLETLFDLGSKDLRSGTAGEKGTGLGLALCKEFAERNGGKIWAESREGKGSVFTVLLPKNSS